MTHVGAMAKRSTGAQRVAGSIPARNKYLYNLLVVFSRSGCLCVCVSLNVCIGISGLFKNEEFKVRSKPVRTNCGRGYGQNSQFMYPVIYLFT